MSVIGSAIPQADTRLLIKQQIRPDSTARGLIQRNSCRIFAMRSARCAGALASPRRTIWTLALAIGANTAMFSFGDATAFRPPDVPRAGEIVRVFSTTKEQPERRHSVADYLDYRDRTTTLAGIVAHGNIVAAMSERRGEVPRLFWAWAVSGNFFSVLEVQPGIGREFAAEDDKPGAKPVAVISHSLWKRHFTRIRRWWAAR